MNLKQVFGHSGHLKSRFPIGAAAFSRVTQIVADATLELTFSSGVNHVDMAASYSETEYRVGFWNKHHGRSVFLAIKTSEQTAAKAREEIHRPLGHLHLDQVVLIPLHSQVNSHEWETALEMGGALEFTIQAHEEGLVRFIGVTGHGLTTPVMHPDA